MDDDKILYMLTKKQLYLSLGELIEYYWNAILPLIVSFIAIIYFFPTKNNSASVVFIWSILAFLGFLIVFLARYADIKFKYLYTGKSIKSTYKVIYPILESKCVELSHAQIDFISGITDFSKDGERISILIQDNFILMNSISEKGNVLIHYGKNKENIDALKSIIKKML